MIRTAWMGMITQHMRIPSDLPTTPYETASRMMMSANWCYYNTGFGHLAAAATHT